MALIKSGMLKRIQGLIGAPGSALGPVELEDSLVTQTLPVIPELARRGLAPGTIGGWGFGLLENVHSGADGESSSIDPYNAGASAILGYPAVVPLEFDVWFLGATMVRSSGAGGLTLASVGINPVDSQQMWAQDDAGDPVAGSSPAMRLGLWDALSTGISVGVDFGITEAGQPYIPINLRVPRGGCIIQFQTEAAAAAEFQMMALMGLFPAALGQDVVT